MIYYDEVITNDVPINENQFYNMLEYVFELMEQFINEYPELFSNEKFEEIFKTNVKCMFDIQYFPSIDENHNFNYYEEMLSKYESIFDTIYNYCVKVLYSNVVPKRSYHKTFIRISPNISVIKNKLDYISSLPQPSQRTKEWYLYRHNLITASNAWKVFESIKTRNQIIYEKCKMLEITNSNNNTNTIQMNSPLHWGNKYEDVSIMIYEHFYQTQIDDFGCIQHSKYNCLGASPDGICNDISSNIYGRMLEIKNVVSRKINGIPKKEYWIQMQLQMEVCNLNECDFLETKFIEYENEEEFIKNSGFTQVYNNEYHTIQYRDIKDYHGIKGIIMCFIENGNPKYYYAPLFISRDDYLKWSNELLAKRESLGHTYFKTIYWLLEDISCVLVLRNKLWFKYSIPKILNIWKTIEYDRVHGYEHRLPKPKKNKNDNNNNNTIIDPLLIDEINDNSSTVTMTSNSTLLDKDMCHISTEGIFNYTRSRSSTIGSEIDI